MAIFKKKPKPNNKNKQNKPKVSAQPQKVDAMDTNSYQIGSVIRNKKGVVTHARIGTHLYDIKTLYDLYGLGYRYYTTDDGVNKKDVLLVNKKGGKYHFATEADTKKENNLDYLPMARLD